MTTSNNVIPLNRPTETPSPVHVMIDTETLGLESNAIILSIGAVEFNKYGLGKTFYIEIDPKTYPGSVDISTIQWWMEQCRAGNKAPVSGIIQLPTAVNALSEYLSEVCDGDLSRLVLWANGIDFDVPKLVYAYYVCKVPTPWKYNAIRDARTVYKLLGDYGIKPVGKNAHNALADAEWQATYLINIFMSLNERYSDNVIDL